MAVLAIVTVPNAQLRQPSLKIGRIDTRVTRLAADMHETMIAARGVGLAAPQVGIPRRLIVVGLPKEYDDDYPDGLELALVNPEIVRTAGRQEGEEGCLSIPGWIGDVDRFAKVTVKATDLLGRDVRIRASGLLARVLQHEIDHLDGVLFTDRMADPTALRPMEGPADAEASEELAV